MLTQTRALLGLMALLTLSSAPAATAQGDVEAGAAQANALCIACHGVNGNSVVAEWPSLAGQNAAYTAEQLRLFRAGHRNNMVMYPLALGLTDEAIVDVAAYYAAQTPTGLEADPATVAVGEALYRGGDRERGIPSCASCHGPSGLGNPAAGYPALRAQHAAYTVKTLTDYATDQRYVNVTTGEPTRSRNGHMMNVIAQRLTADEKIALASYIQGLR
jgi:cytochrome c553